MENEFLILLQAKLDEVKSKGNINTDIDKIPAVAEIKKTNDRHLDRYLDRDLCKPAPPPLGK